MIHVFGFIIDSINVIAGWGTYLVDTFLLRILHFVSASYIASNSKHIWWMIIGIVMLGSLFFFGRNVILFGIVILLVFLFFTKFFIIGLLIFGVYKLAKKIHCKVKRRFESEGLYRQNNN